MLCRTARRRLLEREIGAARQPADGPLSRHLAGCAACREESRAGARIGRELAALRSGPPFDVDVVVRVREGLSAPAPLPRPDWGVLDARAAAWAAAGLLIVFLSLAWGADNVPELTEGARQALTVAGALVRTVLHVAAAWAEGLAVAGSAATRWLAASGLAAVGPERLGVPVDTLSLWAAVIMTALTVLVLAKDARRNRSLSEKGTKP